MKKIRYKTKLTPFKKDERPAYGAVVIHNGTTGEDAFYEKVSQTCGLSADVMKSTFNLSIRQMREELRNGNRVELPQLSAFLSLPCSRSATACSRTARTSRCMS